MKHIFFVSLFLVALLACTGAAQTSAAAEDTYPPVQIIHGPVVETTSKTGAVIAWSTNVNSGTLLRYGTDPMHLDRSASMPWGGITHRVTLKDLHPATAYYFQAESGAGQGTGTAARAEVKCFVTRDVSTAGTSEPQATREAACSADATRKSQ